MSVDLEKINIVSINIVSEEAERTFRAIKLLNKQLLKEKSGEGKRAIQDKIENEKKLWWQKVKKEFVRE